MPTVSRRPSTKTRQSQRKRSTEPSLANDVQTSTSALARPWSIRWLWLAGVLVLLLVVGFGVWHSFSGGLVPATSGPAITSSSSGQSWRNLQTFSGHTTSNATQKTQTFQVSNTWQLTWNCQGADGVDDWLYVAIYHADGTLYNAGAQITCIAAKPVAGSVQEAQGGTYYLSIDADTDWNVAVQISS